MIEYFNLPVRGRVFKRGGWWHFTVSVGDQVVLADNTGSLQSSFEQCRAQVPGVAALVRNNVRLPDHFSAVSR